jgi:hypothetical protein
MFLLSFKKTQAKQNILFDEFFVDFNTIDIISFNYNAQGAALCECDGRLMALDAHRIDKVLFGVHRLSLENYLKSIFDPNFQSEEIHRTGGELIFKSPELNKLKKYDLFNLAKKTLKEFNDLECETYKYFEEKTGPANRSGKTPATAKEEMLFGNVKSLVLHKKSCKSFNPRTCTAAYPSTEAAKEAGYKLCGQCKP